MSEQFSKREHISTLGQNYIYSKNRRDLRMKGHTYITAIEEKFDKVSP